jgi:hypothetical protein
VRRIGGSNEQIQLNWRQPVTIHRSKFSMLWAALLAMLMTIVAQPGLAQTAETTGDAASAPAAAGSMKILAVVAGERYESLIKDITFLGTAVGRPEIGPMVEGGINFLTHGKGLEAIDKTQPWGVIVQTDGLQLLPVGCLPVKKLGDILAVASAYQFEVKDAGDGIKEVSQPQGQAVFVREVNGWAFIGPSPVLLANVPENPAAVLDEIVSEYDLGVRFSVQNVPEMYRHFAIQAMQAGMQQAMEQKPDESEEQFQLRQQMAGGQLNQVKRAIEELDSVALGWTIDSEQEKTYLDVTVKAVPGSRMAEEFAAAKDSTTNFAGFYQPDAAATLIFASRSEPQQQDVAQLEAAMNSAREQFNKGIEANEDIPAEMRDDLKAAAADWFDAFTATVKTGQLDGGATLQVSADSLTLVAGATVQDTAKFESGLKKLDAAAKEQHEFPGIQWNAASHQGVNFHTLSVPVPADKEAPRKLLGETADIAIGIGPEAVYLAAGRDNLEAVKKAIDASAAEKGKSVPPFELVLSLGPVAEVAAAQADEGPEKAAAQAIAEMLRAEAKGRDHLRLTGQVIPNGLRYRFEAEQGVLKALGKAAAEKQRQAQQANQ